MHYKERGHWMLYPQAAGRLLAKDKQFFVRNLWLVAGKFVESTVFMTLIPSPHLCSTNLWLYIKQNKVFICQSCMRTIVFVALLVLMTNVVTSEPSLSGWYNHHYCNHVGWQNRQAGLMLGLFKCGRNIYLNIKVSHIYNYCLKTSHWHFIFGGTFKLLDSLI